MNLKIKCIPFIGVAKTLSPNETHMRASLFHVCLLSYSHLRVAANGSAVLDTFLTNIFRSPIVSSTVVCSVEIIAPPLPSLHPLFYHVVHTV